MAEVTRIIEAIQQGETSGSDRLLKAVYDDLRKLAAARLAQESPGQTLQPTALVHEAYLRLIGDNQPDWDGKAHFFGAASEAMRRILIDNARRKKSMKHGGGVNRAAIDPNELAETDQANELLGVHELLDELAAHDARAGELVKLHYFGGLSIEQAAELLQMAPRTAYRKWAYARAWLFRKTNGDEDRPGNEAAKSNEDPKQ